MFFIVGTGRCGTLSLANTLLEQANCVCLHEPEPSLIEEAAAYRYGAGNAAQIKNILLNTRLPLMNGKTYGEASHKLALVIPVLRDAFPDASYLWLIRSGLDMVASAVGRGLYSGGGIGHQPYEQCSEMQRRWIDHRIRGDRCGDVTAEEWARMEPFERCCWYWQYVNRTIEQDLQAHVPAARRRLVSLEGLDEQIDEVIGWLGLTRLRREPVVNHNAAHYHTHHWTQWNAEQWAAFEHWCGPLMDRCYPQWRQATGRSGASTGIPGGSSVADKPVGEDADRLRAEGEALFNAGDIAGARALFERALARDASNPVLLNDLAVCLWAAGEKGQALLHAAKGLELAPDDRNLVINGGQILESCERPADARALYESYLADFPDDTEVQRMLAQLQARRLPENAPAADYSADDAATMIAEGERHFEAGELDAAEACFQRALVLAPAHLEALNNLGVVRWQRGDQAAALDFLRQALERDPERRETVANLAMVLQGMGHHDTLATVLDAYLLRYPDDGEMSALLESVRPQAGRHAAGR